MSAREVLWEESRRTGWDFEYRVRSLNIGDLIVMRRAEHRINVYLTRNGRVLAAIVNNRLQSTGQPIMGGQPAIARMMRHLST